MYPSTSLNYGVALNNRTSYAFIKLKKEKFLVITVSVSPGKWAQKSSVSFESTTWSVAPDFNTEVRMGGKARKRKMPSIKQQQPNPPIILYLLFRFRTSSNSTVNSDSEMGSFTEERSGRRTVPEFPAKDSLTDLFRGCLIYSSAIDMYIKVDLLL